MSEKVNQISPQAFKNLIATYNEACKSNPEDEEAQQKRRAILAIRRILHGDEDISEDQLLDLADVMTEAYKLLSAKLEEMGFTEYAKQQLTLGEDVSSVVLEIEPIEGGDNVD